MQRSGIGKLIALAFVASGCAGGVIGGGPDGGAPDSGHADSGVVDAGAAPDGGDGGFAPAAHLPLPRLVFHNGTVLQHPNLVTVSWTGFSFATDVVAFGDGVVASQWLATVGGEYGVSGAVHLANAVLTQALPPSMTDADLAALIDARIADGTLPSPSSTPDLLFLVFFPSGTTLDASAVTKSGALCGSYYGYHGRGIYNGVSFPYAVSGDCDGQITSISALASHELIETILDPLGDGYFIDAPATDDWYLFRSFESADLCQSMPDVTEFGYTLERSWSNAAVAAEAAPCLPIPAGEIPYSDVSPPSGNVVALAAGSSSTVQLTGWSVAARASWPIVASDWPLADFQTNPQLSATSLNNGDTVTLTISVPAGTPSGKYGSAVVYSGSTQARFWPVTIVSQ